MSRDFRHAPAHREQIDHTNVAVDDMVESFRLFSDDLGRAEMRGESRAVTLVIQSLDQVIQTALLMKQGLKDWRKGINDHQRDQADRRRKEFEANPIRTWRDDPRFREKTREALLEKRTRYSSRRIQSP